MKNKLKVGVLGAGHLGKIHLRLLNQSERYELVGFYDPNQEQAQKVVAEFGYTYFDSIDKLIEAVEVVDIVTPTLSHYECAMKAIAAKRHISIDDFAAKKAGLKRSTCPTCPFRWLVSNSR